VTPLQGKTPFSFWCLFFAAGDGTFHGILQRALSSPRLLFSRCMVLAGCRQNPPDGLVGHQITSYHLTQGFPSGHSLHHTRPFRTRNLEGWRWRVDMRVLGWYHFHRREKQCGSGYPFQWRQRICMVFSPRHPPEYRTSCHRLPVCACAVPSLTLRPASHLFLPALYCQEHSRLEDSCVWKLNGLQSVPALATLVIGHKYLVQLYSTPVFSPG
jgi:hypothetical protein